MSVKGEVVATVMNTSSKAKLAYEQVKNNQKIVESDPYRLSFHLMPPVGLLNDPNGFVQFKGRYHIFFQWNPFETKHGIKFWGHYSTENFVDWRLEPIALSPDNWYDKNGCYSGSAVVHEEKLYLFYTGNVKNSDNERSTYQCLAVSEDGVTFVKRGPIIYLPEGYTPHFRDPKVWKEADAWYMVIGAQSSEGKAKVVLYKSTNLEDWTFLGPIAGSYMNNVEDFGYMWECPDMFEIDGKYMLLISPQGIEPDGIYYQNEFQSGYLVGEMDFFHSTFEHGSFTELDRGFDFYAPQTTLDITGRRLLVAWMGMSDQKERYIPTIEHNWVHALTLPREVRLVNGELYQTPIQELKQLRARKLVERSIEISDGSVKLTELDHCRSLELELYVESDRCDTFELRISDSCKLIHENRKKLFTLQRMSFDNETIEERHCVLHELNKLHLFIDHSSIEVFLNNGEEVFTSRIFDGDLPDQIRCFSDQKLKMTVNAWELKSFNLLNCLP